MADPDRAGLPPAEPVVRLSAVTLHIAGIKMIQPHDASAAGKDTGGAAGSFEVT